MFVYIIIGIVLIVIFVGNPKKRKNSNFEDNFKRKKDQRKFKEIARYYICPFPF